MKVVYAYLGSLDCYVKSTLTTALELHAVAGECVWMRSVAFVVNALLGSLGLYVKLTLTIALESHVTTEEGVWMEFKISPVAVILDIPDPCVKQVRGWGSSYIISPYN